MQYIRRNGWSDRGIYADRSNTEEEQQWKKIVVKVDGMQCGMCEAHVNEAVRNAFPVKKVTSSHAKETVILTEQDIDDAKLKSLTRPAMRWEL